MLSQKPWQREPAARLILGLIITISCGGFLLSVIDRFTGALSANEKQVFRMVLVALLYQGAALFWIGMFLREHQLSWRDAFGAGPGQLGRTVGLGILGGICVVPIAMGLVNLSSWILSSTPVTPEEQISVRILRESVARLPDERWLSFFKVSWTILAVTVVPIAEEVLFRGIFYPALKQSGSRSRLFAVLATSILFAEIHFNLVTLVPLTMLAMIFTWLYEETGSLLTPILAHSIFNGANMALLLYSEQIKRLSVP